MKKGLSFLLALVLVLCMLPAINPTKVMAAGDSFQSAFFPSGKLQKIKNINLRFNKDDDDNKKVYRIDLFVDQTEDIMNLCRVVNQTEDFDSRYGTDYGFDHGFQTDIRVDGSSWLYNSDWDERNYDTTAGIPDYLGFRREISLNMDTEDNYASSTLMDPYYLNNEAGVLEGCYSGSYFDLKNHSYEIRVRYYVSYRLRESDSDFIYIFSDWSDSVTFGKGGSYKEPTISKKVSAVSISLPAKTYGDNGKWFGDFKYDLVVPSAVTDLEKALIIVKDAFQPMYLQMEACVNDPSEKDFHDIYTANPNDMCNGTRATNIQELTSKFNSDTRILAREYVTCTPLDKKSDYSYLVPQVTGLKAAAQDTKSITLKWNAVENADFYEIYDAKNKLVASTEETTYKVEGLKAGTGYDYKVRAVVEQNFVGPFAKIKTPTAPSAVTLNSVTSSKAKTAEAAWKKLGAGTGYQVYFSTDKNFKSGVTKVNVKKLATLKGSSAKLKSGKTYYVKVRGYVTYGDTVYGKWSKVKTIKVK